MDKDKLQIELAALGRQALENGWYMAYGRKWARCGICLWETPIQHEQHLDSCPIPALLAAIKGEHDGQGQG